MNGDFDPGFLYFAPPGTPPDGPGWIELGETDGGFAWPAVGDGQEAWWDGSARSATVMFSTADWTAQMYWILFRRRHPRLVRMHAAYRRRRRGRW